MVNSPNTVVAATTETMTQGSVLAVKLSAMMSSAAVIVHHDEKLKKFNGLDFKRQQQKILFYLTILNLARFLIEEPLKLSEGETNIKRVNVVDAWKHSDFLCKNYVMNGLHDSLYNIYYAIKTANKL